MYVAFVVLLGTHAIPALLIAYSIWTIRKNQLLLSIICDGLLLVLSVVNIFYLFKMFTLTSLDNPKIEIGCSKFLLIYYIVVSSGVFIFSFYMLTISIKRKIMEKFSRR